MAYPGGKNGSGVYQTIINQIPPHETYIEPFLGSGAILRMKRPSTLTIAIDIDSAVIESFTARSIPQGTTLIVGDAVLLLRAMEWEGNEFIYVDPPYLMETRSTKGKIYRCEFSTRKQHLELLTLLRAIPPRVDIMISGYPNALYDDELHGWRTLEFQAMTRGAKAATEKLWMNYPQPVLLHDYRYLGKDFRERERIKRKQIRWRKRLDRMDTLERTALLSAIQDLREAV